jgi:aarF domain-containing kinase
MLIRRQPGDGSVGGNDLGSAVMSPAEPSVLGGRRRWWPFGSRRGELTGKVQIVLLDHGLYTELDEAERRRMCRLWHAVAMRDPAKVRAVSEEMGVPKSLQWILPQLMARQTSNVKPMGGGETGNADAPGGRPGGGQPPVRGGCARSRGRPGARRPAAAVHGPGE